MTAIAFTVEYMVGGRPDPRLVRLASAFERAGAEVANLGKHIMPRVAVALEEAEARQFEAEGAGPAVGAWAPLSDAYAEWKEQHFPGMPKLQLTGALMAGLTADSSPWARRDISADSLTFGTKGVPYATYHQMGTGKMPARPPIDLDTEAARAIQRAAMAGVREAIKEADKERILGLEDYAGDEYQGKKVHTGKSGGRYVLGGKGGKSKTYLKTSGGKVIATKYGPRKGKR